MTKEKIKNITLVIPVGLPGSGKTYYGYTKFNTNKATIVNYDYYLKNGDDLYKVLHRDFRYKNMVYYDTIYLDGPWFTQSDVEKIIKIASAFVNNLDKPEFDYDDRSSIVGYHVSKIKIIHFNEDREACINNDKGRREESSEITIKNNPYMAVIPDDFVERINGFDECKDCNVDIEEAVVHHTTAWERAYSDLVGYNTDYQFLYSEEWSGGGSWRNCWGDSGTISAEPPLEFVIFDEFLEMVCPNITFLQYKNIKNACCTIEERCEYDYYGGSETYYKWKCDLNKLMEQLTKKGLYTEQL